MATANQGKAVPRTPDVPTHRMVSIAPSAGLPGQPPLPPGAVRGGPEALAAVYGTPPAPPPLHPKNAAAKAADAAEKAAIQASPQSNPPEMKPEIL